MNSTTPYNRTTWPIAVTMNRYPNILPDGRSVQDQTAEEWAATLEEVVDAGFTEFDPTDSWLRVADLAPPRQREFAAMAASLGLAIPGDLDLAHQRHRSAARRRKSRLLPPRDRRRRRQSALARSPSGFSGRLPRLRNRRCGSGPRPVHATPTTRKPGDWPSSASANSAATPPNWHRSVAGNVRGHLPRHRRRRSALRARRRASQRRHQRRYRQPDPPAPPGRALAVDDGESSRRTRNTGT